MKLAAVVPTEENALQGKKGQKREQKEKKSCFSGDVSFLAAQIPKKKSYSTGYDSCLWGAWEFQTSNFSSPEFEAFQRKPWCFFNFQVGSTTSWGS